MYVHDADLNQQALKKQRLAAEVEENLTRVQSEDPVHVQQKYRDPVSGFKIVDRLRSYFWRFMIYNAIQTKID